MGEIRVSNLGKAFKRYSSQWARLAEWSIPFGSKRHELKWVLRDINFNIARGESVGLIGINGAGKSTLLKLITGTTQPSFGEVQVKGRVAALLELGMGFHPDFSGRQNVFTAGQLIGMSTDAISRLMPEIEAFAEIGEYIDQPVRVYSSGMQVRLAFSVATAIRPDILVVDEALAVGDVFFQQKCFDRIRAFCQAGTTLLFVSHSMSAVYSLCNRAMLIANGGIALDGHPREVIDLYNAHVLQQRESGAAQVKIVDALSAQSDADENMAQHAALSGKSQPPASPVGSFTSNGAAIRTVEIMADNRPVSAFVSETDVAVGIEVQFLEPYQDPHIGFQVRNARGEAVFMTNTYCMRQWIGPVQRNERIRAEFRFKASLAAGEYTITAGTSEGGAGDGDFNQTLARQQDAVAFSVLRNMDSILWAGVCNLHPDCQLHRISD